MMIAIIVTLLLLIIFAVIYVFLIMPRVTDRADMDMLSTDFAHRGLHSAYYPENSLPAFELAIKRGYGIELDVQLSADGEIMVFHDGDLKRMCKVDKHVSELTAAQLGAMRLGATHYTVPTLKEVLRLVDGSVPLLIEIKGEGRETELCKKLADALDVYNGAFAVQSFNPLILSWFKNYRPRFARGQLVTTSKAVREVGHNGFIAFMLSKMLLNVVSRPDFISINGRMIKSVSFRLCVLVFKCKGYVWTLTTERQYRKVRSFGLFAIFEKITP